MATRAATQRTGSLAWLRANLFNTWWNAVLTVVLTPIMAWALYRFVRLLFVTGRWEIIEVNLTNLMVGTYPRGELWRLWVAMAILSVVVGLGLGGFTAAVRRQAAASGRDLRRPWHDTVRRLGPPLVLLAVLVVFVRTATPLVLLAAVIAAGFGAYVLGRRLSTRRWAGMVVVAGIAMAFTAIIGFGGVPPDAWGGFVLTLYFAITGIVLSFPVGVAVALGRRSSLPVLRWVCTVYIEFFRGSPLMALLFVGWLVLPFLFPPGFGVPVHVRAVIIFTAFTSAYIAEIVRGGLQGVPKGQTEAAQALGFSPWKQMRLIVLPQALRSVIPALVGQFISLYKDTSLVFVFGGLELYRVARTLTQQDEFVGQGLHAETLLFVSLIYWVGSYWMSRESQRMETRLGVGSR